MDKQVELSPTFQLREFIIIYPDLYKIYIYTNVYVYVYVYVYVFLYIYIDVKNDYGWINH